MTGTNRALNRLFLFLVGVVLLVLGAGAIAVAVVPAVTSGWESAAPQVRQSIGDVLRSSEALPGLSWVTVGVIALLVTLVLLLIVFMLGQGRGRTIRLLRDEPAADIVTVIDAKVAETWLTEALSDNPALLSASVSTFDVRGTPTLDVAVTARRGVSPTDVATAVEAAVVALDTVLGREIPAYLHIAGGFRARTTASTRLQ